MPATTYKSPPAANQARIPLDQLLDMSLLAAAGDLVEILHDPTHSQVPGRLTLAQLVTASGVVAGGVVLGALVSDAPGVANVNDYAPAGFGNLSGGLDITPNVGDTTLTGLIAGAEGQTVEIRNVSATDNLILSNQNAASSASNRFRASLDLILAPGQRTIAVYRAGAVNRWSIG